MASDLPEKLLGITIDDPDDRDPRDAGDDEVETLERFVVLGIGSLRLAFPVDDVRTVTDVPDELARVPRAPPAIEGVADLRGEITAVIDPRVHFPDAEDGAELNQLAVFDHPADQQSAAIRVDEVYGVETVPERDVLGREDVEGSDVDGNALEHPLVTGLIARERERTPDRSPVAVGTAGAERTGENADGVSATEAGTRLGGVERGTGRSRLGLGDANTDRTGEVFELDLSEESDDAGEPRRDEPREVLVEVTPVVDVERLLLASGHLG
ncbi:chemotaxis protein CheW [Natrialbaceae archaeon GCM10025810]|uniref:chemotaxis protein CheW n=1 Tax=Halovalidus salilacus TaxID=3075124 RepID=UPI00360CD45F